MVKKDRNFVKKEKEFQIKLKESETTMKTVCDTKIKVAEDELKKVKEEGMNLQIKIEKLTKVNTNFKQQYDQVNKLHSMSVAKSTKELAEQSAKIKELTA